MGFYKRKYCKLSQISKGIGQFWQDDRGFTLLEMIVVLFTVSIILMLPTISIKKSPEQMEAELFIHRIASEVLKAQNQCIMYGQQMEIYIPAQGNYVRISLNSKRRYIYAPKGVTVKTNRDNPTKTFQAYSGHVTNINRINFVTPWGKYSLRIQLGGGRYNLYKDEVRLP